MNHRKISSLLRLGIFRSRFDDGSSPSLRVSLVRWRWQWLSVFRSLTVLQLDVAVYSRTAPSEVCFTTAPREEDEVQDPV